MLEVKFDNKTLKLYKRYFKDPLAIAKKIFSDCNAKIIPICRITKEKRYAIWTNLKNKCHIAIFNVVDKKHYNVLGLSTCSPLPTKALSASEFDNLFHKKRDIGRFLDISSQKSVEDFEKDLKKRVVSIELDEQGYKDLERLAKSLDGDVNRVAKKLIEDKLKEKFSL